MLRLFSGRFANSRQQPGKTASCLPAFERMRCCLGRSVLEIQDPICQFVGLDPGRDRFLVRFSFVIADKLIEQHRVVPDILLQIGTRISHDDGSRKLVQLFFRVQTEPHKIEQTTSGVMRGREGSIL